MMGLSRLASMTDDQFKALGARVFRACDSTMRVACSGDSSALRYGWDWPTFGVYFPRKRRVWSIYCAEARRRGIAK